jgi:hypothetical protein
MGALPKGTVIFNEEQTRQIMKNKGEVVETYKSGTVRMSDGTVISPEGKVYHPLSPSDPTYQMMKKFEEYFAVNKDAFVKPAYAMNNAAEAMKTVIETINNNNTVNRNVNVDVGGIHVHGVQNPEDFSDIVSMRAHNRILQEMKKY